MCGRWVNPYHCSGGVLYQLDSYVICLPKLLEVKVLKVTFCCCTSRSELSQTGSIHAVCCQNRSVFLLWLLWAICIFIPDPPFDVFLVEQKQHQSFRIFWPWTKKKSKPEKRDLIGTPLICTVYAFVCLLFFNQLPRQLAPARSGSAA